MYKNEVMRKFIYTKFILGYLLFGLVSFLFTATVADRLVKDHILSTEAGRLYQEAVRLAADYEDSNSFAGVISETIRSELNHISACTGADVWLVTGNGHVAYDTGEKHKGEEIPYFDPVLKKGYETGTVSGIFPEEMLSVIAPVNTNFTTIGYVAMHYPVSRVISSKDRFMHIIYLSTGFLYFMSFVLLFIFHFNVYVPVKKITKAASEYAKGNLSYRIEPLGTGDEMEYLAGSLNYMAEEQENLDKYQRDFISNVSHDFRSPLTSIKGYLEAILDGTIPKEMEEKYMRRVIGETERLSKLTEEVLTLGKLDSKGLLNRTVFDVNDLIREVCAANENACREKNLGFELLFEQNAEPVSADREKIERVLYNLIDNALKFSNPETEITVSTAVRARKVYISVKDRGEGIPRDSQKKIWDRFYKGDTSRGRDKKGTGLGLAIVKEIITAHGENIDVVSTENVGTVFTFTLPVAGENQ